MDSVLIHGGRRLEGTLRVQGSKNAVLPIMAASLLSQGEIQLHRVPDITDVRLMKQLLTALGCNIEFCHGEMKLHTERVKYGILSKEQVGGMRSSVLLLGAMLGRFGKAVLCYPGGCVIGKRPIDLHIMVLERMGAQFEYREDCIFASVKELQGAKIAFPFSSVGATQQGIIAAVAANGATCLENASAEPEVIALCRFLQKNGIVIEGVGTRSLMIYPSEMKGCCYEIPGDRIVAGTYLLAAAGCGGEICLENAPGEELKALFCLLKQMGISYREENGNIFLVSSGDYKPIPYVKTGPYPEFATDLQPLLSVVLLKTPGEKIVEETIFENRFCYVKELKKMGALLEAEQKKLRIGHTRNFIGNKVSATDLRGGAALVVAGLLAKGTTTVENCKYIQRGYEDIVGDLQQLGAYIENR